MAMIAQQSSNNPAMIAQQSSNNTVVINQPNERPPVFRQPRPWSTGMCDICREMDICCCGLFCCPCQACQLATDMGESCCVPCCVPGWLITLRTKMRTQENITGTVMDDCCTIFFCGMCVQCQLAREVRYCHMRDMHRVA